MSWLDESDSEPPPAVHCIETGPEVRTDQPYGYTLHFENSPSGQDLLAVLRNLWQVAGIRAVAIDQPDACSISVMVNEQVPAKPVLQDLRQRFNSQTTLTGVAAYRPCTCKHCKEEGATWLGIRVIDDAPEKLVSETAARLRAHPGVMNVAVRGRDTFVLKLSLQAVAEAGLAYTLELSASGLFHVESIRTQGYALRFVRWASSTNPHDW